MGMKSLHKPQLVEEVPYGLYVWQMPNGQWVGDDEGNFLNIKAMKGDIKRISQLTEAVRSYGVEDGAPVYLSGHRQIDDEEFQRQKQRHALGLIPDELDHAAYLEEAKDRFERSKDS